MSEISKMAVNVFEERKETLKKIEERKKASDENHKKRIEHYSKLILNIFDESNHSETSDLLVWKVQIVNLSCEKLQCFVSYSKIGEEEYWRSITDMEKWRHQEKVEHVIDAMKVVEACESSPLIVKDIYKFLVKNISSLYDFELFEADRLKISMHNPADE